MEVNKFIEATKGKHLTIADIDKLNVNDVLDVVIYDRNACDVWTQKHKEEKSLPVREFFKENRAQLWYIGNYRWVIHFSFGDSFIHPIHLDTSDLDTYWSWVDVNPMDGKIHIVEEVIERGKSIPDHWKPKHVPWADFPKETRVGWRGPIMLWKELDEFNYVYWKHDTSIKGNIKE